MSAPARSADCNLDLLRHEISRYYEARAPKIRRKDAEWRGPCPIHHGSRDSFAVDPKTGLWTCHSTCGRGGSVYDLEMELSGKNFKDAVREVHSIVGRPAAQPRRIAETYDYTDESGKLLFQAVRYEPKGFKQRRPDGHGGWIWNLKAVRPVLYHLPELTRRASEPIFLCEGEKDVHTVEALGLLATTNPMGAGKWRPEYSQQVRGRSVVCLPDNDPPTDEHGKPHYKGQKHMAAVAAELIRVGCETRILELPKGKDVSDWVAAGGTLEQLQRLVTVQPALTAEALAQWSARWELDVDTEQTAGDGQSGVSVGRNGTATSHGEQTGPLRFELRDTGLYCLNPGENQRELWICSSVAVVGETRDSKNESWGRLVEVKDRDGIVHKIALPMILFAGDSTELRQALLNVGLEISPSKRARELLSHYIQMARPPQRFRCATKIGWHGSSFILPDGAHSCDTSEALLFQAPAAIEHFLETKGTLEEWRSHVSSLCTGNSRLVLGVSCAFAGPLLAPLGMECGGFHFLGGSSQGKSTALSVAGSVLGGGGRLGFVRQWRSTTNALEPTAEVHNDLTLFLDEIHEAEPAEVVSSVYMLANGMGKARSSKSIQAQRTRSWRCLFFSSGEISLAEHARTGGRQTHGGAEVRLLGIPADAGKEMGLFEDIHSAGEPRAFADLARAGAMRYYGTAIRAFLGFLCRDLSTIVHRARQFTANLLQQHVPAGASGEVRRAAERFFLVALAGELATEFGITGWPKNEASAAAVRCFNDWLSLRGTEGAADIHAGMRQVRMFFQAHGNSRFQRLNDIADEGGRQAEERIINQVGYKELTEDGVTIYYVSPDIFRAEVCRGFNHTDVLRQLDTEGHLAHDNGRFTTRRLVPGVGRPRLYAVRSSVLD